MARTVAIGEQDFAKIIENQYFYIDKTGFIKEWWENGDAVTLITRPRRFGKTLTMNMLNTFFSVDSAGKRELFKGLNIWKEEKYRKLQGTYPVIFLSFAGVKYHNYQDAYYDICRRIAREYRRHVFLLEKPCFLETDRRQYECIMNGDADASDIRASLNLLSEYLYIYYGKKVIILLDEYDTPMQEAYLNGYWDEFTEFAGGLFQASFKTNPYLERGIMTGITRVSKESIFSELNNLSVVTAVSRKYEAAFGFTEEEVLGALEEFGLQSEMSEVKRWYDGFRFGDCGHIYNPWSITRFLDEKVYAAYWANTSSNRLVGKLIQEGSKETKMIAEDLLNGKSFCMALDEQIVFQELDYSQSAVWSLLLASGYLKITGYETVEPDLGREGLQYKLALTNLEIVSIFRKMVRGWFAVCSSPYNDFIKALLVNDIESMNVYMNQVAFAVVSSFDSGNRPSEQAEPERFYHGFVLGIMVDLAKRYRIASNRESGFGRYDVLMEPCSSTDDGIIFEFKVFQPKKEKSLEDTARSAIRQIIDKKYAAGLQWKCKRDRIRIYGFAFRGKEVLIDGGYIGEVMG